MQQIIYKSQLKGEKSTFFCGTFRILEFHSGFTPAAPRFHGTGLSSHQEVKKRRGCPKGDHMFWGMEWYWWLIIVIILILSVPLKMKFMNWRGRRTKEKKENQKDKWGDEA